MFEKNAKAICESDETDKLKELIADFMSNSNDKRSDAKSIFKICINKPNLDVFANKLYHVLSSSLDLKDLNSCILSAILLRKSIINKFSVPFLSADTQSTLKGGLLKIVRTSVDTPDILLRRELCHTVSALAASLLPKKEWPEFLPFLLELIESDQTKAGLIGAHLAQYLGKGLKELHLVNLDKKLHLFLCSKTTTEGEEVRMAVWGAAINFILCSEQKDLVKFQDMLTAMMSTLKKVLYKCGDVMAIDTLKTLINLAGMKPPFLRKQIVEMVKTMLLMADDHTSERLALEFVLTLVQFVVKLAEVEKLYPSELKLGTEFEINMAEMWDDNEDTEETDNYWSWESCAGRLLLLSDRNDILTVACEVLPHPALLSKSIITWNCGEGLLKEALMSTLEDELKDVDRDEVMGREVLKLLIELGKPRFLMEQIMEWVKRMWQIANNGSLKVGTRRLAIEFLLKLAQVEEVKRWLQKNVQDLFGVLMNAWDYNNEDHVNAWDRSNKSFWRNCLDKLLIAVDRNGIFSAALEVLPAYLNALEWQKRHAAFLVLTQRMKSCREGTIENLEKIVPMVLSPFPNAHRYVRCAAIKAIQQLLTHLLDLRLHEEVMRINFELIMSKLLSSFQDDDPVVQKASIDAIEKFGERLQVGCHLVLPALAKVMNDSPDQDMRDSAASIILDFSKYCTQDNLNEHLEGSIRSCLIVLKEVKKFEAINRFTEWEMILWHDVRWHDMRSWQEKLSEAWVEIWRNEERDFSPYVDSLMSPVLGAAQLDPDNPWYDRFVIIEEKAMACHVLCFCVDELTELLVPLIGQVVYTLIPFLKWYHDAPGADARYCAKAIRIAVASAMPKILNSVRSVVEFSDPEDYDHAMQYVEELSDMVMDALNEASEVEPDAQVRYDILYALRDCQQ